MFVKSIKIATDAMFPIFRWNQLDKNQVQIGVGGTGFFINDQGYFASVAHIFDNPTPNTKFLYSGRIPDEIINPQLQIEEVYRNDDLDIYIGKVNIKTPIYFHLSKEFPDIGKSVCVAGYPLAQIKPNQQGGFDVSQVRRYFQPTFVLDKIIVNSQNGKDKIRKHDGFLVRDVGLFGMSGGPVFDVDGLVVGIQGSVTAPRTSDNGSGRTITVENAVVIKSELILDILNKEGIKL